MSQTLHTSSSLGHFLFYRCVRTVTHHHRNKRELFVPINIIYIFTVLINIFQKKILPIISHKYCMFCYIVYLFESPIACDPTPLHSSRLVVERSPIRGFAADFPILLFLLFTRRYISSLCCSS